MPNGKLIILLFLFIGLAFATATARIPFQASGFKLANGTLIPTASVSTYVYVDPSGGSPIYSETWASGLQDGYVSVTMGNSSANPLNLNWGQQYWLAVSINSTPVEMVDTYGVSSYRQAFISTMGEIVKLTQVNASVVAQSLRIDNLNTTKVTGGTKTCSAGTVIQNLTGNSSGIYGDCITLGGGSGTPGGNDTQIQFNDGGSFGGNVNFTYNKTERTLHLNNTINTTTAYTVGDASNGNAIITYYHDEGGGCNGQNEFPNDMVPFYIYVRGYIQAFATEAVWSANPLEIIATPSGDTGGDGDCWTFEADWDTAENATMYDVQAYYAGSSERPADNTTHYPSSDPLIVIYYNTPWGDAEYSMHDSPFINSVISWGNGIDADSTALIRHGINISSGNVDAYGNIVQHGSAGVVVMTGMDISTVAGIYGNGVYLGTAGSPRVCLQSGTQRLCFDYYVSSLRFIEDSSMANVLRVVAATGEFILFSGGSGGTQNFDILGGKIKEYNDIATEGYGVPAIVDDVSLTARTTNITTTAFTNAGTAGQYRVSYYVFTSTAGYANAGNISINLLWNDGTTARVYTAPVNVTLNSTTSVLSYYNADMYLRLGSGSISYNVTVFGNRSASQYAFYATAERLN